MTSEQPRHLELIARLEKLYTAVVSDELDKLGFRHQVMRPDIRPLFPEAQIAGQALPVLAAPIYEVPKEPYKLEMAAIDSVQRGDVMVVSTVEGSFWGELLSTAARYRGAHGVVLDGYTRDSKAIIEMGFPCFMRGIHMTDSLGRVDVIAYDVPVECGGVQVAPRDFVFGDYDGVVVIPHAVADEVITSAEEKVRGENLVRQHLQEGMPITEAFQKFGIL